MHTKRDKLKQRIADTVERVLDDESLMAGLDDETADLFLEWAIRIVELAVHHTANDFKVEALIPLLRQIVKETAAMLTQIVHKEEVYREP